MKHRLITALRFVVYGVIFFSVIGLLLQWPYNPIEDVSGKVILYLGLVGGGSFAISHIAAVLLLELVRDLIYGSD